jgi:IS605 OrfB family transposase
MGDAVKKLVKLAYKYECPISVENLDFERKKATMKEEGIRYSRMLSNFAYGCFLEMLNSCALKHGIDIIKVNPAFSSLIGLTKFMRLYGLSSDRLAALVLARRALRKKEGIPTNYARVGAEHVLPLQVDFSRPVGRFWNALSKKLKGVKRHSFFSVSNREVEVKLLNRLHCNKFDSKSQDTSIARRDSLSRILDLSAQSGFSGDVQHSL